ncbi:F-box incomplete domain containing protein [Pandoravirus quercus]|uniref:F-box incomplete domain containing protein n=2 Tax=Pandoravirus TaxID=2060084 RepID=A0A2U7U9P5_9VIRU|nr:F-box incomplete domain containing protein [Pandoravirus quercus]AVK75167.1 F-box incomplete domain containing protein [Pandoravirus quercus]QBZ81337.1 F-box incomplete domain containing protein [Pandoravirus celtis]
MEAKGSDNNDDRTTDVDCTRYMPNEILDMILVGNSTSGDRFLDVRWRWTAARVCKRWRTIIIAARYVRRLQHLPGHSHQARRHVQQGRALCLSIYRHFDMNARQCDIPSPPPLLVHLMAIAANQPDAVEPALRLLYDMRTSSNGDQHMLGSLAHCGPCDRLKDARARGWCIMCRVAARAGALVSFAALWRRLPNGHTKVMLDEAVIGDCPGIVSHILVCTVPTWTMIHDLWSAVGYHGAAKVAMMLLDMEPGRVFEVEIHDGTRVHRSWKSARECSPWLAHAIRMNRTHMVAVCRDCNEARHLLEAAIAQGAPVLCDAVASTQGRAPNGIRAQRGAFH